MITSFGLAATCFYFLVFIYTGNGWAAEGMSSGGVPAGATPTGGAAGGGAAAGGACPSEGKSLEDLVVPQNQKTNNWCWAAVAQMVMARYGTNLEQCIQVTDAYRKDIKVRSCCDDDNRWSDECNRSGWPHLADYGFHVERNNEKTGIEWSQLTGEICADRPFIFTWEESANGVRNSHQYVAIGYRVSSARGKEIFVINPMGYDPIEPAVGWISFEGEFRKDPSKGVWNSGTLLNIQPE